jgi:polysaccharide export outer membrane protein
MKLALRHRTKYRFPPTNPLPILAWVLISAIAIAAPVNSDARDPSQVREFPQARDVNQVRNTPQSGSNSPPGNAVQAREIIGASDSIRITVFQNPDLTTETRVSQSGSLVLPLIGEVGVSGLTPTEAGARIADQLKSGRYIINPQVSVAIVQARSRQVTVLGQFARPGNYMLEDNRSRLTDILTLAGGISSTGAETIRVLTNRGGKYEEREINFPALFRGGDPSTNIQLENGDTIYVERAPVFYIYGEVQRAGAYRLEPNTIVIQALSLGGGLTARGSERGIGIHRRMPNGELMMIDAKLTDALQADDVVFVRERLMEYRLREDMRDSPQAGSR